MVAALFVVLTSARSDTIDRVLTWLPPDTETVMAVTGPGKLAVTDKSPNLRDAVRYLVSPGLPAAGRALIGINYTFILHGARKFRPPGNLGLVRFEGCNVFGVSPEESVRLKKAFGRITGATKSTVGGLTTYVIKERSEQDIWSFAIAFDGEVMFIATDTGYLSQLLARRSGKADGRALPDSLPEWKYIDRVQPFWAVRHFTPASLKLGYGLDMNDPKLIGYALCLKEQLVLISLSDSSDGFKRADTFWTGFFKQEKKPGLVGVKPESPGVTRITFDAESKDSDAPLFTLMAAFGHGVFI
jgi:hypothetical protein